MWTKFHLSLLICYVLSISMLNNVNVVGNEIATKKEEDEKPDVPVREMTPEEEEELAMYQGCAEKQFTSCGNCLFNGNTYETRTKWCTNPAFCFETTDPDDHIFDMFCKGEILHARSDEARHTIALRCGEEHEPSFLETHGQTLKIGSIAIITFAILFLLSFYLSKFTFFQRFFYSLRSKNVNSMEGRKKDDDVSTTPTKAAKRSLESNRKSPVKSTAPVTPIDKAKSWISTLRSPSDKENSCYSNGKNKENKLVTPFASPASKTFCASSDDV